MEEGACEKEKSTPESDWSVVSAMQNPENLSPGQCLGPPMPPSFLPTKPMEREEDAPVPVQPMPKVYGRSEGSEAPSAPSAVRRADALKILPPSLYKPGDEIDRKAGATSPRSEPVEQIAKALQSQTAELASLVRHQAEGAGSQPAGTLKGLGRQAEELVFLMRACGQYDVKLGEGEHGQALANGLLAAQVGAARG